ncbi:uncharacterized protein LOC127713088 isoform X1 [Mytilus californianus]|uniref:uncharacterized protein LOC127713088 isoform X1 n=1 Tax=Mytilus californianus TaxID=6549 RepID=UPI0022481A85|nr:uncharacterized protein LOC127713088 isoform X1 [Mytilus californianus]
MASLVANYGSESDSEDESPVQKSVEATEDKRQNYLITEDNDSDESDSSNHSNIQEVDSKIETERLPNPLLEPLPSASNSLQHSAGASVFVTQYHIAEKEKELILEKHVKLSATKIATGKKQQICHKFKRGRCRFGNNCKYSHDIDNCSKVQNVPFDQETDACTGVNKIPLFTDRVKRPLHRPEYIPALKEEEKDDDSYMGSMKRKNRAGLSGGLIPSKKALSSLGRQRAAERPWTVDK